MCLLNKRKVKMGTKVICIEGLDGSGKTTLINNLDQALCEQELNVKILSAFDIVQYGRKFKSDTLNSRNHFLELTGMAYMLHNLQNHVSALVREAKYDVIILDRYIPSFYTYQIFGRDTNIDLSSVLLNSLNKFGLRIDNQYLIKASFDNTKNRLSTRSEDDGDRRAVESYDKHIDGYVDFFEVYGIPVKTLSNDNLEDISRNVAEIVADVFSWRSRSAKAINTIC